MSDSDPSPNAPTGPRAGYNERPDSAIASKEENAFPKGRLIAALIFAVILTVTLIFAAVISLKKMDEASEDEVTTPETALLERRDFPTQQQLRTGKRA